jgi:hypothetical protein
MIWFLGRRWLDPFFFYDKLILTTSTRWRRKDRYSCGDRWWCTSGAKTSEASDSSIQEVESPAFGSWGLNLELLRHPYIRHEDERTTVNRKKNSTVHAPMEMGDTPTLSQAWMLWSCTHKIFPKRRRRR